MYESEWILEQAFKDIVGDAHVLVDEEALYRYAHDETEDLHFPPDLVLRPGRMVRRERSYMSRQSFAASRVGRR